MRKKLAALLLLTLFAGFGCNKDENNEVAPQIEIPAANQFVFDAMNLYYLWYDKIPVTVKPENYAEPIAMLDDMIYEPLDRWTYMVKDDGALAEQITQGTQQGVIGVAIGFDAQNELRVLYVLPGGPADVAGIKRSDVIQKVNGTRPVPGQALSFGTVPELEVRSNEGDVRTLTLNRATLAENPVLHKEVKELGDRKVAYLVFNTFNGLSVEKLDEAFASFKEAGANELIVDLRYNGGGLVNAAHHFASLMIPSAHYGKLFMEEQFNDKNTRFNDRLYFEAKTQNLSGLSRIVFLTTGRTASASELIINGLKPFIDVTLIGQTTTGKYVGASLLTYEDYTFIPVTFQSVNANNEVFIGGFTPDLAASDDITRNFGDPEEGMLRTALDFLQGNLAGARRSAEVTPVRVVYQEGYWEGPALRTEPLEGLR